MDLTRISARVVQASRRHAWLVIVATVLLGLICATAAVRTLAINTDTTALFDRELPFRVAERAFNAQFPGDVDLVVAVIDGPTASQANRAADELASRLLANTEVFVNAYNPTGGDFFARLAALGMCGILCH